MHNMPLGSTLAEFDLIVFQVVSGVVESLKIITRQASKRVAQYAFHYAKVHGRKRVSAIHKANIMKKTDGLFLEASVCSICDGSFVENIFNRSCLYLFLMLLS